MISTWSPQQYNQEMECESCHMVQNNQNRQSHLEQNEKITVRTT